LSFEQENVESTIGALRHWTMTGKLPRRSADLIAAKRNAGLRALAILDAALAQAPFLTGEDYTIADIALFAYASRAEEAGIDPRAVPAFPRVDRAHRSAA
jgi:glutathione S-transferase